MAIHPEGYLKIQLKFVALLPKQLRGFIKVHHKPEIRVFKNWLNLRKIILWYIKNKVTYY